MLFRLVHAEAIAELILQVPRLVDLHKQKSTDFPGQVLNWLNSLEQLFTANRMHEAGAIALLRAKINATEQGQIAIKAEFRTKPNRSQLLQAAALEALDEGALIAQNLIRENKNRFADAGSVARQVISAAASMGLLFRDDPAESSNTYLERIRGSLKSNPELSSALVHLDGLVGQNDALILIDRALAYVQLTQ